MTDSGNNVQPGAGPDAARPMILVVDDQAFIRQTSRAALEEAGFRVEEASGGEEALELFRRLRPDLVVLDLLMPGMDGFDTCVALRRMEEGRRTPILAVTGLRDTDSIHRAFDAGATDCVSKPVSGELLGYRVLCLLRASRALEELTRSEGNLMMLREAVESLPLGMTICDADGKIIYTNPADAAMHGFEVGELLDKNARVLAPERIHHGRLLERQEISGVWRRESINCRKNGNEFPVQLSSVAVRNSQGEFLGIVSICEDITERKENEARIHQLAYYDPLTRFPNRTLFLDRLQKALAQADRYKKSVAVLFLDLDHFKDINDTQGHEFGDRLLTEVARRLSGCVRAADTLARLGGDEFVIMLAATQGQETAGTTARRIQECFRSPFEVEGREIHASISIGIALYPNDARDMEGLMRCADSAMYQAKASGRQNFQFFSATMNRKIVEKVALESALRLALERQELTLFYQPQWDLQAECPCGVEVLVRWRHSELGEIPPSRFIPLAENSGLIFPLGEMVLRTACNQAKAWAEAGHAVGSVAVNISGHQLRQPDFPDIIKRILAETQFDPMCLELEFTESVLMEHGEQTITKLKSLKEMGVQLAIDDFGTGYSSLSYLKHFPVDRLKIDQAFIAGIGHDPSDAAIVEAVIALAHTLKIRVLAEGVEMPGQLKFLQDRGCDEAQGFLLGIPMGAADLIRQLKQAQNRFPPGAGHEISTEIRGRRATAEFVKSSAGYREIWRKAKALRPPSRVRRP